MFYVAEALLVERGKRFRKHSAVHAAFGEQFAKAGLLESKYHRWLLDAFDRRIVSDYDTTGELSPHEVRRPSRRPRNSWHRRSASSDTSAELARPIPIHISRMRAERQWPG